jgi:hypothetical protein
MSAWRSVFFLENGIIEAKRTRHVFRADHSECYCCRFHYCLPENEHGYDDGKKLVAQIMFYKENDERDA